MLWIFGVSLVLYFVDILTESNNNFQLLQVLQILVTTLNLCSICFKAATHQFIPLTIQFYMLILIFPMSLLLDFQTIFLIIFSVLTIRILL